MTSEDNKLARERNRRAINEDGSTPLCLLCGVEARKHLNRHRWYATCGNKECALSLRIGLMIQTKSKSEFKEVAKKASIAAHKKQRETIMPDGRSKADHTKDKIFVANTIIGDDGLTNYERASRKSVDNVRLGNELVGHWIPLNQKSKFDLYKYAVKKAQTNFIKELEQLEHFEKRGQSGLQDSYHLDHKVSISFGFINNVDPKIIGHICNLEMKPWLDNIKKSHHSDLTLEELRLRIDEYETNKYETI